MIVCSISLIVSLCGGVLKEAYLSSTASLLYIDLYVDYFFLFLDDPFNSAGELYLL